MQPLAADHLILEIAPNRARRREPHDIGRVLRQVDRISPLEIDAHRQIDRAHHAGRVGQREIERHLLTIGPAIGVRNGMAPRRQRLGSRCRDRLCASRIPHIVKHDRIARYVQRGEGGELAQ